MRKLQFGRDKNHPLLMIALVKFISFRKILIGIFLWLCMWFQDIKVGFSLKSKWNLGMDMISGEPPMFKFCWECFGQLLLFWCSAAIVLFWFCPHNFGQEKKSNFPEFIDLCCHWQRPNLPFLVSSLRILFPFVEIGSNRSLNYRQKQSQQLTKTFSATDQNILSKI